MSEVQQLLSEVSTLLADSLDYTTTLQRVAELAVPLLADHCIVDLVGDDLASGPIAVAHVNPERARRLDEVVRRYRPAPSAPRHGVPDGRLPRPQLFEEVPDELLARVARDAEHLDALRELGPRSVIVVPMIARERPLGGIMLVMAESGRRYGPADLAIAEDLARRAALAVDNARLYRQAQEALRVRDDVLAFASHDLKAPLTSMRLHIELLQEHPLADTRLDDDPLSPRQRLARLEALTTRMSRLVGQLVEVARLSLDQDVPLRLGSTDLVALARQAVAEHQQLSEGHTLRLVGAVPELIGCWDVDRLGRVLDNLLGNAIKYTPEGGSISVEVRRVEDAAGAWALLRVIDQGCGIPPEDLPHVFDRFYRGRNVAGHVAGTGLGLAGARHIVEGHGGTILVDSVEGRGTTVTVRLPLVTQPAVGSTSAAGEPAAVAEQELRSEGA